MVITKKTCLITGCSAGGVGAALADMFRDNGYHVFATARTTSKIPSTLRDAPNVTVLALDVTSAESIAAALKLVQTQTPKLDVLVNNAGLGLRMPGLDTSLQEAKKLFDANFFAALAMMQAFAPLLIAAKGCLVNNSSITDSLPLPFTSLYNASKAALTSASETWRLELAPLGVRVMTLVTGGLETNFHDNVQNPVRPEGSYYSSVWDVVSQRPEKSKYSKHSMGPAAYARDVFRSIESGATGKVWVGTGAGIVRLLLWLLPQSMADSIILKPVPFTERLSKETADQQYNAKQV